VNSAKNGKKCKKGKIAEIGFKSKTIKKTCVYMEDGCF
jgi:hypothetical protein